MPILLEPPVGKNKKPHAFGASLRAVREGVGISQAELARRAGIHAVTVSRLESGKLDPTLSTIETLAAALEVSAAVLISARLAGD